MGELKRDFFFLTLGGPSLILELPCFNHGHGIDMLSDIFVLFLSAGKRIPGLYLSS